MKETRLSTLTGIAAVAALATGALLVTEAATRAAPTLSVVAVPIKENRIVDGSAERIDRAFAVAASGQRYELVTGTGGADACMPDCSSTVFKSAEPGAPSRIVPGGSS